MQISSGSSRSLMRSKMHASAHACTPGLSHPTPPGCATDFLSFGCCMHVGLLLTQQVCSVTLVLTGIQLLQALLQSCAPQHSRHASPGALGHSSSRAVRSCSRQYSTDLTQQMAALPPPSSCCAAVQDFEMPDDRKRLRTDTAGSNWGPGMKSGGH
jgi:hypothetical protein